ncbi:MAG: DNA mismatch repair protein MutS [Flavobacteriales bacterium]
MKQYYNIKAKYPDALLLFRVGDFYETFGEDAIKTANILGIVLTKRANGAAAFVELAGFPHHSLDNYLPKLVRAGYRVAICDQLEDPKQTKTIVKRGVTELVTPGITINDKILDHKSNNFLAAVHFGKSHIGISFLDISTGEFYIAQGNKDYADKLLQSFQPGEVLVAKQQLRNFKESLGEKWLTYALDEWVFQEDYTRELLLKQFETRNLKGFGVEELIEGSIAAGTCLHYLHETNHHKTAHIISISRVDEAQYVWLDRFTVKNLELFHANGEQAKSLFDILNQTITPMGARLLRRWLALPLKDLQQIRDRLDLVDLFIKDDSLNKELSELIKQIGDLERIIAKVAVQRINPREVLQLNRALTAIVPIIDLCKKSNNKILQQIGAQFHPCTEISHRIKTELAEDAPAQINKGGVIAQSVHEELDELRAIKTEGKNYLLRIQQREIEKTGITSLKIAFNNVFGYYLEVTNAHKDKVPTDWIRKQTLVNAERYITPELKEFEEKILGAEEKILQLEQMLFEQLVNALSDYIQPIQHNASLIARLDCLLNFAVISLVNQYQKPALDESLILDIKGGRHPVIEQLLPLGEQYVDNDVYLDADASQILMITGPNMSGKSALLRQTALIVIMAQIGCFVPAQAARIGLIDKIFTRVGASDSISSGESTFMVEMNETASIMNNLSERSLILLDEIGRGTSTYDGISIAWAIAEYLHEHPQFKVKTLFATHYHELNDMEARFQRIRNFNVSVKEVDKKIIFLRKLKRGGSEHSFGIHVAKMAGMPKPIVERAEHILKELEQMHQNGSPEKSSKKVKTDKLSSPIQLSFFQLDDPLIADLRKNIEHIDINTLTPVEALLKLSELKRLMGLN